MPPKRPPPPSSPPPASSSEEDEFSSSESEDEKQPQQQTQQIPQQTKTPQQTETSDDEDEESESEDEPPSATTATKANPPPKQKQSPNSSSSTENEEDESGSEDDDVAPPPPPKPTNPHPASQNSEEEDSDSEDDDDPPTLTKPPAKNNDQSKPQNLTENSSEDDENSSEDDKEPPPTKPAAKPVGNNQNNGLVKRKREGDAGDAEGPKKVFQRVWSLEDEIAILHGLIRYRNGGGSVADSGGFYDFVRGSLKREVNKGQLTDKVRKLKAKFQGNFGRTKNGVDRSFSNEHEKSVFELSKDIWETAINTKMEEDVESKPKKARVSNGREESLSTKSMVFVSGSKVTVGEASGNGDVLFPYLSSAVDKMASEYSCGVALKKSLGMLDLGKARALEEKLKAIKLKEAKQHMRRIQLVKESVKLITDALSRSD